MCKTYFVNLNNNTIQLKRLCFVCSSTFTAKENKKSSPVIKNLRCCHFDIVILRTSITNNVQNVRLQRRHRPTDDASTHRWRGLQQTGPANNDTFIMSLATISLSNVTCTLLRFRNHGKNVGFDFSR